MVGCTCVPCLALLEQQSYQLLSGQNLCRSRTLGTAWEFEFHWHVVVLTTSVPKDLNHIPILFSNYSQTLPREDLPSTCCLNKKIWHSSADDYANMEWVSQVALYVDHLLWMYSLSCYILGSLTATILHSTQHGNKQPHMLFYPNKQTVDLFFYIY